jgi:hypothetical protein
MESRRKQEFKKGVSAEDGRRRRGETSLQLRKEKKEEILFVLLYQSKMEMT